MLKKEISNSRKLGEVKTDRARVLYFMMLPHLDVQGRLEADVRLIKGQITTMLPYSEKAIQACLEQLHNSGLVVLYSESNKQYLEYTRFEDFQTLNPNREAESKIPAPTPDNSRGLQTTPLKISKVKVSKDKYKDKVFLTLGEYEKLVEKFGQKEADGWIDTLDEGIAIHGYKYDSHYRVILKWSKNGNGQQKPKRMTAAEACKLEAEYEENLKNATC